MSFHQLIKRILLIALTVNFAACASALDIDKEALRKQQALDEENQTDDAIIFAGAASSSSDFIQDLTICFDLDSATDEGALTEENFIYECPGSSGTALVAWCEEGCFRVCAVIPTIAGEDSCSVRFDDGSIVETSTDSDESDTPDDDSTDGGDLNNSKNSTDKTDSTKTSKKDDLGDKTDSTDKKGSDKKPDTTNKTDMDKTDEPNGPTDTTCPSVIATHPTDGETEVATNFILFCFDEAMDPNSFSIDDVECDPFCNVLEVGYDASSNCAHYIMKHSLACLVPHKVELFPNPTDTAGNNLCESEIINFETKKTCSK